MSIIQRILIFCGLICFVKGARECPDVTKAHLTRCDMYYRCTIMPSDNIVWVPKNCPNGLVYDTTYRNCVMPGDDWECQLDNESRSSAGDDENVYGINNLNYLKEQVKGYDPDESDASEESSRSEEQIVLEDDNDNITVNISNGTIKIQTNSNSDLDLNVNSNASNEIESSGDGDIDSAELPLETKSDLVPMPTSDKLIASQLQHLTQLIQTAQLSQNEASDLSPDELNQFVALQKLKMKKYHSNKNAVPLPHNKLIDEQHLHQILELQKKLNDLANKRNTYSTPTPIIKHSESNGYYPAEATTVHIKTANAMKNPTFPNVGAASSQIVVNRPGGSVVFRLPYSNQLPSKSVEKKPDEHISAETLKLILELSKHMSNQAPNTPHFVHSLPSSNKYAQSTSSSPIFHPLLHNFPWDRFTAQSLLDYMNTLESDKIENEDPSSMEQMSSVSGTVQAAPNLASQPDDVGPTTIIHNHIPITVSNPSPTNSIVNRVQSPRPMSTTMSPILNDPYDDYDNKRPSEQQSDERDYYPYPTYSETTRYKPLVQKLTSISSTSATYHPSSYSTQSSSYDRPLKRPQYIKISQSPPSNYEQEHPNTALIHDVLGPIPTFVSVGGSYPTKIYSTYAPQPHLSDGNVNDYVNIDHKPYPTLRPVSYIPIATASSPAPSYANPPEVFNHVSQYPHVIDKVDRFHSSIEASENTNDESYDKISSSNNNNSNEDYSNSNVEQNDTVDDDDEGDGDGDGDYNNNSNENVMNLLANYNTHFSPSSKSTPIAIDGDSTDEKPMYKQNFGSNQNHKQFVSLNGNYLSLETYQKTIEPFLEKGSIANLHIDVLTCATGVRQANKTDCTRYFVCNEKTSKILSYKCPPYTAFNGDIKICNGETYARCFSTGLTKLNDISASSSSSLNDKLLHKKIQQQIIDANRIKAEAQKQQQLAHFIKLQTDKILSSVHQVSQKQQVGNGAKSTPSTISPTRPTQMVELRPIHHKPQSTVTTTTTTATKKQKRPAQHSQPTNSKFLGKRKVPCKDEGKLIDNLSNRHYFLCFKDQTKTMRARRMQCPAKLIFCPTTLVCTANERCSDKFG